MGALISHEYPDGTERPIAFGSKTLSSTERKYSQVEKEGLSIIFGVKKFFQYLYGRRFTLITDHKPLLQIFGEKCNLPPLIANRLHRWALFLNDFQFDIQYRPGSAHGNADALSRLPLKSCQDTDKGADILVKRICAENAITSEIVKQRTFKDPILSHVIRLLRSGWPQQQSDHPQHVRPFFSHRYEYTVEDGVLLWGSRVVVPSSLRQQV